jgi:hypothetical protein
MEIALSADGIPEVPPELECLSIQFANDSIDLARAIDHCAATPAEWLRHYRDLFWASAHAWRLLIRGYYRLEIEGGDVERVGVVANELERLLLLRGEDRPDVVITAGRASRVDVRLVRATIE